MGYYSRKKDVRTFDKNPAAVLYCTFGIVAFVAALFGLLAFFGHADTLAFTAISFGLSALLFVASWKSKSRSKKQDEDSSK